MHNYCLGKDVFEDENISALLKKLFVNYCSKVNLEELEFFDPIPGITSFYDLLVYFFLILAFIRMGCYIKSYLMTLTI